MKMPILTNVATYKAIAADAFESMRELIDSGRMPKDDRSGWILQFDPKQRSFRQAMIVIVFVGMWLEASLHLWIVRNHSAQKFQDLDFKSYEDKLRFLGISDQAVLESATRFRRARKELVHEKAHFDSGKLKTAQDEADNAYKLLLAIESFLVGQAIA